MPRSATGLAAILVLALSIGGLVLARGASAQNYPPPVGSLSVEAAPTTPGGTTDVTATVLDNAGNPVEGAEVIFRIVSQPGTDACWPDGDLETTAITDANGVATAVLTAGSATGNIIIETLSGDKTSQVTVAVQEEAEAPVEVPVTGGAPAQGSGDGLPAWQIALLAIVGGTLAGGFAIMIRRNKKA
jgi:hypothetical protein